ncbi:MAG: hypothetical protein IJK48_06365 [Bacteroidales bacterium]|nr:hypothetical protein [Bacteroidales bacterium]
MTKNNGVYLYPDELLGWRYDADNAERNAHLFWDNQDLFQIAHETEAGGKRFLFSHVGVGRHWLEDSFPGLDIGYVTPIGCGIVGFNPGR